MISRWKRASLTPSLSPRKLNLEWGYKYTSFKRDSLIIYNPSYVGWNIYTCHILVGTEVWRSDPWRHFLLCPFSSFQPSSIPWSGISTSCWLSGVVAVERRGLARDRGRRQVPAGERRGRIREPKRWRVYLGRLLVPVDRRWRRGGERRVRSSWALVAVERGRRARGRLFGLGVVCFARVLV